MYVAEVVGSRLVHVYLLRIDTSVSRTACSRRALLVRRCDAKNVRFSLETHESDSWGVELSLSCVESISLEALVQEQ